MSAGFDPNRLAARPTIVPRSAVIGSTGFAETVRASWCAPVANPASRWNTFASPRHTKTVLNNGTASMVLSNWSPSLVRVPSGVQFAGGTRVASRGCDLVPASPPEHKTLDLAARRLRQLIDDVHGAGIGVGAGTGRRSWSSSVQSVACARPTKQSDIGLYQLTPDRIRSANYSALPYNRMSGDYRFDLERADPVTSHDYDVVISAGEEVRPVFVSPAGVPRQVPKTIAGELLP